MLNSVSVTSVAGVPTGRVTIKAPAEAVDQSLPEPKWGEAPVGALFTGR
ncbi:hypothetical protein STANM309S_04662 [Streptomyces tanashiensis]